MKSYVQSTGVAMILFASHSSISKSICSLPRFSIFFKVPRNFGLQENWVKLTEGLKHILEHLYKISTSSSFRFNSVAKCSNKIGS